MFHWVVRELEANPTPVKDYWYGNRYGFTLADDGRTIELHRVFDDPVRFD